MYTNMARVLSEKDELDPMFKVWVTAGYLVREDGGRHNLHQREGVKPKRKSKVKQEDVHSLCSSDEDCDQRPAAAAAAASSRPVVVVAASLTANRIRRVPRMSEVVGFIHARHEEKLHPGSKATYAHLEGEFVGIPRILCEAFVARCGGCLLKVSHITQHTYAYCIASAAHPHTLAMLLCSSSCAGAEEAVGLRHQDHPHEGVRPAGADGPVRHAEDTGRSGEDLSLCVALRGSRHQVQRPDSHQGQDDGDDRQLHLRSLDVDRST